VPSTTPGCKVTKGPVLLHCLVDSTWGCKGPVLLHCLVDSTPRCKGPVLLQFLVFSSRASPTIRHVEAADLLEPSQAAVQSHAAQETVPALPVTVWAFVPRFTALVVEVKS
jgi:hypothetical protein